MIHLYLKTVQLVHMTQLYNLKITVGLYNVLDFSATLD